MRLSRPSFVRTEFKYLCEIYPDRNFLWPSVNFYLGLSTPSLIWTVFKFFREINSTEFHLDLVEISLWNSFWPNFIANVNSCVNSSNQTSLWPSLNFYASLSRPNSIWTVFKFFSVIISTEFEFISEFIPTEL